MRTVTKIEYIAHDGIEYIREWVTDSRLFGQGWKDYYGTREQAEAQAKRLGVPFYAVVSGTPVRR